MRRGPRHQCWNGAAVDGPLAAQTVCAAVLAEIQGLAGFDDAYLAALNDERQQVNAALNDRLATLDKEIAKTQGEIANVVKAIREVGVSTALTAELQRLEESNRSFEHDRAEEARREVRELRLPPLDDLKELGRAKFRELAWADHQFAAELRRLTPRIVVFPHRLIDGGPIVLRARFRLQLAELVPDPATRTVVQPALERVLTLDLFRPPQREAYRAAVVAGRRGGEREQDVALRLGITHTAAQRAMELQRRMEALGLHDPYQPVAEPPEDGRMKRHNHARYRFDPLPDAGRL